MTQKEVVAYWQESAEKDKQAAEDLFQMGHYSWSLFIWHLVLEKTIKGIIASQGQETPPLHDLFKLAQIAKLDLSDEQEELLKEVSTYNIAARYDHVKYRFYQKATQDYTTKYTQKCAQIYQWLRKKF